MKSAPFSLLAMIGLLAGCAGMREMGGPDGYDENVLTGGPVRGTKLSELPAPVRETLEQTVPHGEVSDIDKTTHHGRAVYIISFAEPGRNPKIQISEEGQVLSDVK